MVEKQRLADHSLDHVGPKRFCDQKGWFRSLAHADTGTHLYNGYPWRFSRSGLVCRLPAPRVGEHSAALLHDLLGIESEGFDRLAGGGVTGAVLEWPEGEGNEEPAETTSRR